MPAPKTASASASGGAHPAAHAALPVRTFKGRGPFVCTMHAWDSIANMSPLCEESSEDPDPAESEPAPTTQPPSSPSSSTSASSPESKVEDEREKKRPRSLEDGREMHRDRDNASEPKRYAALRQRLKQRGFVDDTPDALRYIARDSDVHRDCKNEKDQEKAASSDSVFPEPIRVPRQRVCGFESPIQRFSGASSGDQHPAASANHHPLSVQASDPMAHSPRLSLSGNATSAKRGSARRSIVASDVAETFVSDAGDHIG